MSRVLVVQGGTQREFQAEHNEILLDVLRRNGLIVTAPCGGKGICGKCMVTLEEPDGTHNRVLACKLPVLRDLTVLLDEQGSGIICDDSPAALDAASHRTGYGAAVDLGSTTVALKLFDLSDGREVGSASAWNRQAPYGADVITRTQYCMEHPGGLARLSTLIRAQIRNLLEVACKNTSVNIDDIKEIYLAGNTVMEHLLFAFSPASIAVAPFTPQSLFDDGKMLAMDHIPLYPSPCVAGYVGGDITAGLLACSLHNKSGRSLFLDIGTNGEMALSGPDDILCCAVASGPAFEGSGISCGMTSTEGAISAVRWGGSSPVLTVIGGGTPKGICGSGILDLLAMLLKLGIVDESGYLQPPDDLEENFAPWLDEDEDGNGIFYLTPDRTISFTSRDVRAIQLAKAAVAAGISVLLEHTGIDLEEIDALYLAGGFGSHLNPDSAVAIGMLPEALRYKIIPVGNAALTGASMALLDPAKRITLLDIQRKCTYLELSGHPGFNRLYPEHMTFDKEDSPWK